MLGSGIMTVIPGPDAMLSQMLARIRPTPINKPAPNLYLATVRRVDKTHVICTWRDRGRYPGPACVAIRERLQKRECERRLRQKARIEARAA